MKNLTAVCVVCGVTIAISIVNGTIHERCERHGATACAEPRVELNDGSEKAAHWQPGERPVAAVYSNASDMPPRRSASQDSQLMAQWDHPWPYAELAAAQRKMSPALLEAVSSAA